MILDPRSEQKSSSNLEMVTKIWKEKEEKIVRWKKININFYVQKLWMHLLPLRFNNIKVHFISFVKQSPVHFFRRASITKKNF